MTNRQKIIAIVLFVLVAAAAAVLFIKGKNSSDANWAGYGGPDENHYSTLTKINDKNINRLGLAWHYDIQTGGSSLTAPISVDGVVYFAGGLSVVHALDAKTGKLLWQYDPHVGEAAGHKLRAAWGSRGIAYANGRIFTGTLDGRLIALDSKTGALVWSVMTIGKDDGRYISGAPWVYKDKVVIGHGGADFAPVRGYVTAYDQSSGRQVWRFFTVPGDPSKGFENNAMAMAARTWSGEWWKFGGGATVWNAMSYDAKYNRLYIGTGNGSPWNQKIRSPGGGDNLFLCSIIALDADTGQYVWHYQTNPGESWDYNSDMDIEQTTLNIDGKPRDVILHAPKNGFFYVIDRRDGKLISARNYVPVNWARGIDQNTGRPIENPEARFPNGQAAIVYPSPFGAHNIEAMAFSPKTGLTYIPAMDQGRVYIDPPVPLNKWNYSDGQRISNGIGTPPADLKPRTPSSMLIAWDALNQREAWRTPYEGARGGGGIMATAGNLIFQGRGKGTFVAQDARSGRQLWSFAAQTAVMAQPITYSVDGKQYITIIAGSRFPTAQGFTPEWDYRTQQWRVLTFALDGKDALPVNNASAEPIQDEPAFVIDAAKATAGETIYGQRCAICHGGGALSGGAAPHLLRSAIPLDRDSLTAVLHEGLLVDRGMPKFEELSTQEIEALQHYIRSRARQINAPAAPKIEHKGKQDEGQ